MDTSSMTFYDVTTTYNIIGFTNSYKSVFLKKDITLKDWENFKNTFDILNTEFYKIIFERNTNGIHEEGEPFYFRWDVLDVITRFKRKIVIKPIRL